MKIAIIGSRNLSADISKYIPECITEIMSGGTKHVIDYAKRVGKACGSLYNFLIQKTR